MLWFRRLNLAALALCFVVIVFGAYVRLSDAGLGCPDWPGCYGHLTVPEAPHEVAAAEQTYPQRPVEAPKAWKEMIHRYLASTLGMLIVGMALLSLALRSRGVPRGLPWVLVALVIFQGLLGMWTVTWQLKPLAVSGHLLGGMATLSLLLWLLLSLRKQPAERDGKSVRTEMHAFAEMQHSTQTSQTPTGLRYLGQLSLALLVLQIFLGGWTSSNYAALACPDFPTCHGSYWPQTDIKEAFTLWRGLGINYEHGVLDNRARVTIHFAHRLGALVVTFALLMLAALLLIQLEAQWKKLGAAVVAALTVQVILGISIVKLQLPLFLADLHNAGAAILLMTLVAVNYFALNPRPATPEIP
jgi:cytochrome c oxidase assembly protein subunit 15